MLSSVGPEDIHLSGQACNRESVLTSTTCCNNPDNSWTLWHALFDKCASNLRNTSLSILKTPLFKLKKNASHFQTKKKNITFFQRTNEYYFDSEKKNIVQFITCYTRILLWFSEEKDHLTYLQTGSSRGCKQIWYCQSAYSESDGLDWREWSVATGVCDAIFALSFKDHFEALFTVDSAPFFYGKILWGRSPQWDFNINFRERTCLHTRD